VPFDDLAADPRNHKTPLTPQPVPPSAHAPESRLASGCRARFAVIPEANLRFLPP
jgi:hypothetical protein